MHLAPTEDKLRLRARLRQYFKDLLPDGLAEDPVHRRELLRRIGADGLLGLGWPVEYGGQGRGPEEQFVFFDEAYRAGAPVSMVTLNTVGPTLMRYGTQEQKDYFLPRILRGDTVFAIGYSEPEAGTDLASLRTRAVRTGAVADGDGDGAQWVIDGQKVFTSNAQNADWIWLACRTDPQAPKHEGISIILVPTDAAGFSWTPIDTVGGLTTTATYYDSVRVPAGNLVGPEHGGWGLITNQLNHERVALAALGMQAEDFYEAALEHARTPDQVTGERRADLPWVRSRLAEAHARLAAVRLLNWRLVQDVGGGTLAPGDASGVKFLGTESAVEVYRMCQEAVGEEALVRGRAAFAGGELERMNRAAQINTFGGGVSEVQREIVAMMRLGMKGRKR
ncbi:acyl-CoA dehydrogenase [Streptomyces sp. CB00455]|uniref:acyl-CoA dehydrogenase family protein n=1 Tax=Streptomyces sp. CB00455 TaxID=1703927 RepID=UPI00093AF6AC|nr:acyl-CoA dehydrogenase family protein [Streptomyces sp. CB00455]OKK18181.1 acyl-CoA dehydrogenase [Streptomyces sp. CB00455]